MDDARADRNAFVAIDRKKRAGRVICTRVFLSVDPLWHICQRANGTLVRVMRHDTR